MKRPSQMFCPVGQGVRYAFIKADVKILMPGFPARQFKDLRIAIQALNRHGRVLILDHPGQCSGAAGEIQQLVGMGVCNLYQQLPFKHLFTGRDSDDRVIKTCQPAIAQCRDIAVIFIGHSKFVLNRV